MMKLKRISHKTKKRTRVLAGYPKIVIQGKGNNNILNQRVAMIIDGNRKNLAKKKLHGLQGKTIPKKRTRINYSLNSISILLLKDL